MSLRKGPISSYPLERKSRYFVPVYLTTWVVDCMQEKILNYWPKFLQSIEIWPKFWWFQCPDQTAETTFGTCINTCLILYVAMHFGFNLMLYVISKHIPLGNIHHTMLGSSLRGSFCVLTNTGSVVLLGSQGENQKMRLTLKYWHVMILNTISADVHCVNTYI